MSWFGINKNEGRHNNYNRPKLGELGHVHRPVIIDANGVKHPILGYERHNCEQYMARTEAVVKYRGLPGRADEEYTPSRTEEYETGDLSGRKNEFAPKSHDERVREPIKDSPWDNGFRFNSPPSNDHHHNTHDDDIRVNNTKGTRPNNMKEQDYYDDEKNRRNGFSGSRSNYLKDEEDYYERANPKTNGYSPPKYAVPMSTHQVKEKGNDFDTRDRMGPFGTPPRNETSYETSNVKPIANSPPRFNPQPKKEERNYNTQQTINSTEARRRYGKGSPGAAPAEDRNYSGGTINSKEAARRYNGVLLTS